MHAAAHTTEEVRTFCIACTSMILVAIILCFVRRPAFSIDVFEVMLQYCPEASTVPCVADSSLPIHTALRNIHCNSQAASYIAAKRLLEVYPGAADQADSFGFLPLHLLVSRCDPDTSLLRRLLAICPLGVETATFKDAGQLLPIHCAVVAARPSRGVIQLLLDAYPEGLMALCAENLGPLDYMFLNLKCQYSKRNMLRSATPSLRAPLRKELYEPVPPAIPRPLAEPTLFQSVERLPSDLLRDLALIVDMPSASFLQDGLLNVDDGDSMALRNNNVMSYFKGKTDEEILYLTLDLLKNNNYEVTDDMIVLFGSRLSGASSSEIMEDSMMFRGDFSDHQNFDDGCQCVIM